jgi:glycosyltransferase involved in cell wall biosynthesis
MIKIQNKYLLDVIMLAYNHEHFIGEAIQGIIIQKTSFRFRLLIFDDCSQDKTKDIIDKHCTHNNINLTIEYFRNKVNIGASENGKQALESVSSKYIALCEGDDYWTDPYKLQKQVDFLEANEDYSMCFHEVDILRDNVKIGKYSNLLKDTLTTEDFFDRHIVASCSMLFRNIIVFPSWTYRISSGDKLIIFLLSLKGKIKFINETSGVYRLHAGGIHNSHYGIKKVYDMSVLLNLINDYTSGKYEEYCKKSLMYEIDAHIISKIPKNKNIKEVKTMFLLKELKRRLVFKVKRLFK